ncbi:hypothetical protein E5288_WYG004896 [Bos mutus]|uniref:Uncharacterized protein n=1 Tax=Bos mutus TaxID=72004 RepID=A0A6B0R380_9CETA|nr:hypothetical protein [Bos mutus]
MQGWAVKRCREHARPQAEQKLRSYHPQVPIVKEAFTLPAVRPVFPRSEFGACSLLLARAGRSMAEQELEALRK